MPPVTAPPECAHDLVEPPPLATQGLHHREMCKAAGADLNCFFKTANGNPLKHKKPHKKNTTKPKPKNTLKKRNPQLMIMKWRWCC